MKFTYETQGAITYLVCELDNTEKIDGLTLGMLSNNHIAGLAPVIYTEMDGLRYLKYNISAKVSCDQFFSGNMNKERTLRAFSNLLNAICSADEYMIDQNCFSVVPEHIFFNVSNCESALICLPVICDKDINADLVALFKKIVFSTQFDSSEDASYITQLITYINGSAFNVYGMKDLVECLKSGAYVPPVQNVNPAVNNNPAQPVAPVSSFDATISIDDMPGMMGNKPPATPPVQPQPQPAPQQFVQPPQPPVRPAVQPEPAPQFKPQTPPAPPIMKPQPQTPPAPQMKPQPQPQPAVPPQRPVSQTPAGRPITPAGAPQNGGMNRPPVQNGPGFAVPGKNGPGFAIPGQGKGPQGNQSAVPPTPAKQPQNDPKAAGDKKMSFFGLLANYNKENAALYKQQKAEAKAKKAENNKKPAQMPVQPAGNVPGGAPVNQQMNRPPVGAAPVPPYGNPSAQPYGNQSPVQPAVQPMPIQNSFNETTVLGPSMFGGETTVLGANPALPSPALIRVKTGERVNINKPVFRIGKEKSYVDYFIADNTAISRSHCNIHTENGEYFIEDTNSTNHTYINGQIVNSNTKTKIKAGDKVRLANEEFTFTV